MKKFLAIIVSIAVLLLSGCNNSSISDSLSIFDSSPAPIEVKNGFIDITVDKLQSDFNSMLSNEYTKANLQSFPSEGEHSYHFCNLGDGVDLTILATPDSTMTYAVMLTLDMTAKNYDAKKFGYYYSKLLYTVAPDITDDEILEISEELDIAHPMPGDLDTTARNNIIYALKVEDSKLSLSIIANKTA